MRNIFYPFVCELRRDEADRHTDTRVCTCADVVEVGNFGMDIVGAKDRSLAERVCKPKRRAFEGIVVCNKVFD